MEGNLHFILNTIDTKLEFEFNFQVSIHRGGRETQSLIIGWQNLNPLSYPNAPQARQARASGENLNYMTVVPQASSSGEISNIYSQSC